jgi:nitroreductase
MSTPHLLLELADRLPRQGEGSVTFAARELGEDELRAVLAAARVAPSADNAQTWRFVTVRAAETRAGLARAVPESLAPAVAAAPLVIVTCGVRWIMTRARREQPFMMIDVPIAVAHMLLEAAEIGLACAWTLDCDEGQVRQLLEIPDDVRVIALLALGWPREN